MKDEQTPGGAPPGKFHCQRIAVNGITLNVVIEGEGPDVLLVHGFPDDHDVWRKQIPALVRAGYRVIAPDTRGCGGSDMPPRVADYALPALVADLAGLLDALGVQQVRLVAHDWGALIGWFFCLEQPQRVLSYVALSVGHPSAYARAPLEQKLKGWYVLFFQLRGIPEWVFRAGNWWFLHRFSGRHGETARWIPKKMAAGRLTAAINYYRANIGLLLAPALPKVTVPVLGVWSSGDRYLAERQMTDSAAWVSGPWRYARIEQASHWLQLDAPEQVNALLLDALR